MRNKQQKAAFTLLEIIIVIAILGLVASVVGWQIATSVKRYAFQNEIEAVYRAIKQSQLLSLVYKTDIDVQFLREDGVFYYCLRTDEPFTHIPFDREKKALHRISRITWNDKPIKHFEILIFSHGAIQPQGILGFFSDKTKAEAIWFDMQGGFLVNQSHRKPSKCKEQAPLFPEDALKTFHMKKQESTLDQARHIPEAVANPVKK